MQEFEWFNKNLTIFLLFVMPLRGNFNKRKLREQAWKSIGTMTKILTAKRLNTKSY